MVFNYYNETLAMILKRLHMNISYFLSTKLLCMCMCVYHNKKIHICLYVHQSPYEANLLNYVHIICENALMCFEY